MHKCSTRKYPYPPQIRLTETLRGRGISKNQIFLKRSMALKLNFQTGGGGFQAKKSSMEGMWIFSGTTQ